MKAILPTVIWLSISIGMLLLALLCFGVALRYAFPVLVNTIPALSKRYEQKTAMATVTEISKGSTTIHNNSNTSSTSSDRVTVEFLDENDRLFRASFTPLFNTFTRGDSVKVNYQAISELEQVADRRKQKALAENRPVSSVGSSATPASPLIWLQHPLLYFLLGCAVFIFRFPVTALFKP